MTEKEEIYDKHPELFHYTNSAGVAGILRNRNLWATHFKFLNDASELQLMEAVLAERLYPVVKESIVERYRDAGIKEKKNMQRYGGPLRIAESESAALARAFSRTAFEDSPSGPALATPYITSFCAHTYDQAYERENGLLSKWRGYATGGYAIVFDTRKLVDLFLRRTTDFIFRFRKLATLFIPTTRRRLMKNSENISS